MSNLPGPPYTITAIDGEPEQDTHGNWGAFVKLDNGESALLRMKGPFPIVGDTITDRVLQEAQSKNGNTYLKLVKPQRNGSGSNGQSRSTNGAPSSDGPSEAYWEGKNAAIGRAHAQEMALRYAAIKPSALHALDDLKPLIEWFHDDAEAARQKAVEGASAQQGPPLSPTPGGSTDGDRDAQTPPEPPTFAQNLKATESQQNLMVMDAKKRGLSGEDMRIILKAAFGVESFGEVPRDQCIERWRRAISEPVPVGGSDVPPDPWPETQLPAETADDDVPF